MLFWAFSILMGASLSYVFIAYTDTSIVRVFFITKGMFGAMSLYGYTTKRSLVSWGSFLFMGLIGVIIAMVVNIFLQSEMMHFVISVIGVLVFLGLTAYDTQRNSRTSTGRATARRHGEEVGDGRTLALSQLHQHLHSCCSTSSAPRASSGAAG